MEEDEVPRALGHLLPLQEDVVVVHPVPGEAEARGLRLGDLALVVGKLQVNPPGVEVKAFPQVLEAHGRALNVPAGVPLPQGLFQRMMCPGSAAFQRAKSRGLPSPPAPPPGPPP